MNDFNGYELSRIFFDWCFENPEKITPTHIAMYFFIIEHCNRLGWKEKFGLPTTVVKDAIGIRNFRTYSNTLTDLVKWGFIKMIEVSKNQYSSNIIAIVKNNKATAKATAKALDKALQKQSKIIVSINKQENKETIEQETIEQYTCLTFDEFWILYDKKIGDKSKLIKKWNSVLEEDRISIKEHIPQYKTSQPEKRFRKNPETYLNNKSWNDEIIFSNGNSEIQTTNQAYRQNTAGVNAEDKKRSVSNLAATATSILQNIVPENV